MLVRFHETLKARENLLLLCFTKTQNGPRKRAIRTK
jgi:hypothetical protein